MVKGFFGSVVIDIINVLCISIKTENHAPVGAHCNSPEAFERAFERMQPEPWHVHMGDGRGGMKRCQNISQLANMFRVNAARIVLLKKTLQSFMADCPYHHEP